MAIIALPNTRLFRPRRWESQMAGAFQSNISPVNKARDTVDLIGDGWAWRFDYGNNLTSDERDEQRGYWDRFRGGANLLQAWPPVRPEPRGTLRGSPTLSAAAAEGAGTIVVAGSGGSTLLAGDFLEVPFPDSSTQLVEIHSATGSGTITCTLVAPLRKAASSGAALVWLRPSALFHVVTAPLIPHEPKVSGGFTVELEEFIP